MPRPQLTLYLDVISPFAYMAHHILKLSPTPAFPHRLSQKNKRADKKRDGKNSPAFKQCDITYVPILLGGIMKKCNNRPPIDIKNKDKWIELERERHAKFFNVPIRAEAPKPFPQPTVNAGRALCAVSIMHPERLSDCIGALYEAFWIEGQTINSPEVIGAALAKVLGAAETRAVMENIASPQVKKMLIDNTDVAFDEGAFGLPWFVATNAQGRKEAFWGIDHLDQVADHLGVKTQDQGVKALL